MRSRSGGGAGTDSRDGADRVLWMLRAERAKFKGYMTFFEDLRLTPIYENHANLVVRKN